MVDLLSTRTRPFVSITSETMRTSFLSFDMESEKKLCVWMGTFFRGLPSRAIRGEMTNYSIKLIGWFSTGHNDK